MASTTIEEFNKNWAARLGKLAAAGVSPTQVSPIIKEDWSRVQQGSSPYSGTEADVAIQAALSGQAGVVAPSPKPHGLLGTLENIPSDIGGIASGLTTQLVAHPVEAAWQATMGHDPSKAWQTLKQGWTWQQAAAMGLDVLAPLLTIGTGGAAAPEAAGMIAESAALEGSMAAAGAADVGEAAATESLASKAALDSTRLALKSGMKKAAAGLMAEQGIEGIHKTGLTGVEEHPIGTLLMFTPAAKEVGEIGAAAADAASGGALSSAVADKAPGIAAARLAGTDLKASEPKLAPAPTVDPDPRQVEKATSRLGKVQATVDELHQRADAETDPKRAQNLRDQAERKLTKAQEALHKAQNPEQPAPTEAPTRPEDLTKAQSVYEAARAGKPLRAIYRAALPEGAQTVIGHQVDGFLHRVGVDDTMREAARTFNLTRRDMAGQFNKLHEDLADFMADKTPEERQAFHEAATRPDLHPPESLDADTRTMIARVNDWNTHVARLSGVSEEALVRDGFSRGRGIFALAVGEHRFYYADQGAEAGIADAWESSGKAHVALDKAQENLSKEEATTARVKAKLRAQLTRTTDPETRARLAEKLNDPTGGRADHQAAQTRLEKASAKAADANQKFFKRLAEHAPASYQPMVEAQLRDLAKAQITGRVSRGVMTSEAADAAFKELDKNNRIGAGFSDRQWNALRKAAQKNWFDLAQAGYAPTWVHTVSDARFAPTSEADVVKLSRALSDRYNTPDHLKAKTFDFSVSYQDVGLAMSRTAANLVEERGARQFVNDFLMPRMLSARQVDAELRPLRDARLGEGRLGDNPGIAMAHLMRDRYVEFDPEKFGLKGVGRAGAEKMYLPKEIDTTFKRLMDRGSAAEAPARGLFQKSSQIMRKSLFFEPRHIAHLTLGAGFAGMMRGGLDEIPSFFKAWRLVRDGNMPPGVEDNVELVSADQLWQVKEGQTVGRIIGTIGGAIQRIEEHVGNTMRAASFLAEQTRALRSGADDVTAREMGLEHIRQTYMDMEGMTPFEQMVIRQYFPFYGFSKYVMRYLLTFPSDHPVRAAVVSSQAETEQKLWDSGLPQTWQGLASLGDASPDGEIAVSNIRSLNPFRDAGNLFTLTGIIQGLNPLVHMGLQAVGVNTLSGTPDLYPQLQWDAKTGQLQAKRPGLSPAQAVFALAPPTQTLDTLFGFSAQAKSMKATNPDAFRAMLFDQLGIPFAPYKVNLTRERFTTAKDRYMIATQDVTNALSGKGTGALRARGATTVPYQGKMVPANMLAELIDQAQKAAKGMAPKTVLPKTSTRKVY